MLDLDALFRLRPASHTLPDLSLGLGLVPDPDAITRDTGRWLDALAGYDPRDPTRRLTRRLSDRGITTEAYLETQRDRLSAARQPLNQLRAVTVALEDPEADQRWLQRLLFIRPGYAPSRKRDRGDLAALQARLDRLMALPHMQGLQTHVYSHSLRPARATTPPGGVLPHR